MSRFSAMCSRWFISPALAVIVLSTSISFAQTSASRQTDSPSADQTAAQQKSESANPPMSLKRVFLNLPGDQQAIWTSPFHARKQDAFWLLPLAGTSALLIGSDQHSMLRARSNADAISLSQHISDGGVIGLAAVPAAMYFWGALEHAPRPHETGLLAGEALFDSLVVDETLKYAFARHRPTTTGGQGEFFNTLSDPSFPSGHSMLAWTAASVIAHEYRGGLIPELAYATAATVSITRVTGRRHFPSDVVVGGAMGWLIGRQVYNAHHGVAPEAGNYGVFSRSAGEFNKQNLGSPFVPLESWIYPALQRLAALGYIKTQFTGLQPWTRRECMRQVEEAERNAQDLPARSEVVQTIARLKQEFADDGRHFYSAQLDSIYARYMNIAGPPLRDSYHFGQTIWNDFGRPYDRGGNAVTGADASAVADPFFFYARGEYQHAPGRGPFTDPQRTLIASLDSNSVQPASPIAETNRFQPLEMYAGVQMGQYALTFGKQSLWLGPGAAAPLMLGDNPDPMYMLRLTRTSPLTLPGVLHYLGQVRGEFLFAKLSGHQFPERPFFNLQKLSFHLTENLELGFTRASIWAGEGHPFTFRSLARNFFSTTSTTSQTSFFGNPTDPGDRKAGFDFAYKLPGLRKWLTLYSDSYSDDDTSPLASPRRAAINPGLYLSHFPFASRLDLRVEAVSTQSLTATDRSGRFLYFNNQYHDANLNNGFLFGSPTGRDARAYQSWSTYHFSAVTSLQAGYRQLKTSNGFLPGGGTQSDASLRFLWRARPGLSVDAFFQYERWLVPSLSPGPQRDVTSRLQLTWMPKYKVKAD